MPLLGAPCPDGPLPCDVSSPPWFTSTAICNEHHMDCQYHAIRTKGINSYALGVLNPEMEVLMQIISEEAVVNAPLDQVYNQWTQFEEFPSFMKNVEEVRQLDDRRLFWRANLLGEDVEWEAVIDQQIPNERIEWHAVDGRANRGLVRFEPWEAGQTKVSVEMQYELDGLAENVANAVGLVGRDLKGDLERFKDFIENREHETGAWRGRIARTDQPDERAIAEERQREPGPAAAPGGTPVLDERTGDLRN